ncbi:MAG: hypothetical protein IJR41_04820 [Atopobiaceae bacterium]|nr:hypothetical protein [Atopobiaceae bacterium]
MREGRQTPRLVIAPECSVSYGRDAGELSAAYGIVPDEWQQDVLDVWLAEDSRGQYAALSSGLSVPRQNGKNAVLEMREVYGTAVLGESILHTAHRVDTARKAFLRLASFFENPAHPEMCGLVKSIRRTNGQEGIELTNGGVIEFSSRVNGGKRGYTADVVVFDEAQELNDDQVEAIMSTMAAAPSGRRQLIYTGTPPTPVSYGTVFKRERDAALSGAKRQCWHEWSIEECIPRDALWDDVVDLCYETNPAMGIRLDEEFTEKEFRTLSTEGFARERLGWWRPDGNSYIDAVISRDKWDACLTDEPPEGGIFVYGVKFSPDGSLVSLCGCLKPEDGKPIIEHKRTAPMADGIGWLVNWLMERRDKAAQIVIDGKNGTQMLVERLISAGMPRKVLVTPSTGDVTAACSRLLDAVNDGLVTHSGQEYLTQSATQTERRRIGNSGGWGFRTTDSGQAEPIEACALALWQAETTKRKPGREAKVAF